MTEEVTASSVDKISIVYYEISILLCKSSSDIICQHNEWLGVDQFRV